ncbi:MAG: NADH-quinone oxidoreductase subunit A [Acidobacteria bacterium]|nr:NADH-quinone oxidoreductase subunit A [Acidobacteriota bacterium]
MPSSPLELYFPLLVQALLGIGLAIGLVGGSFLLGQKVRSKTKESPYECGMAPIGSAGERFSVKFYLVAMLFILFEIEAVFLFPWVVVFRELKMVAFVEMFVFVILIFTGFIYIWGKGVLDWSKSALTQPGSAPVAPSPNARVLSHH